MRRKSFAPFHPVHISSQSEPHCSLIWSDKFLVASSVTSACNMGSLSDRKASAAQTDEQMATGQATASEVIPDVLPAPTPGPRSTFKTTAILIALYVCPGILVYGPPAN